MVEYFGNGILNEENEIDRKKLGPLVFSNKVGLKQGKANLFAVDLISFVFAGPLGKAQLDGLARDPSFIHQGNQRT